MRASNADLLRPTRAGGRTAPIDSPPRRAAVIGAGLAGAAAADALHRAGMQVTVIEAASKPATGGSSQPAGLFHPVVHPEDGIHARWFRSGALTMARWIQANGDRVDSNVAGRITGLWRGSDESQDKLQALAARLALPAGIAEPMPWPDGGGDGGGGSESGAPVPPSPPRSAWWMPQAGWAHAGTVVDRLLGHPGIDLRTACTVHSLEPQGRSWRLLDADGHLIVAADVVVLANAGDAMRLVDGLPAALGAMPPGTAGWPLTPVRGQTTLLPAGLMPAVAQPRAAGGYLLPMPDGSVLCGATAQPGRTDLQADPADDAANLRQAARLVGRSFETLRSAAACSASHVTAHVGVRWRTPDRLPLVGPLPQGEPSSPRWSSRASHWPAVPGLWLLTGLGSRGLSQALLAADLLVSRLLGWPLPVPRDLVEAVDPARFVARRRRKQAGAAPAEDPAAKA